MTFTYDPATLPGKTRLYCQDTVIADAIFTDAEIAAFLDANNQNAYLAAADALDIIAASQAYVLKVMTNNGLTTDGAAEAAALRETAKTWREKAARNTGTTDTGVTIVTSPDDEYLTLRVS
jgi:hypothetical protein